MTSIDDARFDENLSLRDAYRTMYEFLVAYHNRGETQTAELLAFVHLHPDGGSGDPAHLQDFVDAFERVKQSHQRNSLGSVLLGWHGITNRWTRAAGARFSTSLVPRRLL